MTIPLSLASITAVERSAVERVLRSGWLSQGQELEAFEAALARQAGRNFAVAVNSGTSALHLALLALGIGPRDEVVTTPYSFVATTNAILLTGATPVFADIDRDTLNLDPMKSERACTARTRALLPVEVLGNGTHMAAYERIAHRHHIHLVEDACEAIGATYMGRPAGGFGVCSVFGFFPNKQITTGEGGVVLTDSEEICGTCVALRNHGRRQNGGESLVGYNYKMDELSAAIGCAQLGRLDEIVAKRRRLAQLYGERLAAVEGIHLPPDPGDDDANQDSWFAYVIRLDDDYSALHRNFIAAHLQSHGVMCSTFFEPIHLRPHVRKRMGTFVGQFPHCEHVAARTIALPFFTDMTDDQVSVVCEVLVGGLAALKPASERPRSI